MPPTLGKGFTLIELLIVIAIIAVLSTVVILTLNPAELMRQARDSNRVSDMSTLRTAISIYLTDVPLPSLAPSYSVCYLSTLSGNGTTTPNCGVFMNAGATINASTTSAFYRNVDSNGWLPVKFTSIISGAPFGQLPVDPLNNSNYYYAYAATSTGGLAFEVDALMESVKYGVLATKDGGDNNSVYEVGTKLTL